MNLLRKKKPIETTVERDVLRAAHAMRQAAREAHQKALETLGDADAYVTTLQGQQEHAEARIAADMDRRSEALTNALKSGMNPATVEASTDNPVPSLERQQSLARKAHAGLEAEVSAAAAVVQSAETKTRLAIAEVLRTESADIAKQFIEADALAATLRTQLAGLRALGDSFLGTQAIAFEANDALHRTASRYPDQAGTVEAAQQWRAHAARLEADAEYSFHP